MKIAFISDTHTLHNKMWHQLPEVDMLIHCGDVSSRGKEGEITDFIYWYMNLTGFDKKIFIAGNHDFGFEHFPKYDWLMHLINEENLSQSDCVYLEDDSFVIQHPDLSRPIKIYGSPWQPEFYNWAFNLPRNGAEIQRKWNRIPEDTDILITHGPPMGILDEAYGYGKIMDHVGCEILKNRIEIVKPLIHAFGHIHGSYGGKYVGDTLYINASTCDEKYVPINKPIVVEITEVYGELVAQYLGDD